MSRTAAAEIRKLLGGRTWWVMFGSAILFTSVVVIYHALSVRGGLDTPEPFIPPDLPDAAAQAMRRQWASSADIHVVAARLYTAGSTLGWLLALLSGILVLSREFRDRTTAATFMQATRGQVISAKFAAAAASAAMFWAVTTLISVLAGGTFLYGTGSGTALSRGPVLFALGANLFAYLVWAVIGLGIAAVAHSQTVLVAGGTVAYLTALLVGWLADAAGGTNTAWATVSLALPTSAAQTSISGSLSAGPSATLILLAYAAVAALTVHVVMRRADFLPQPVLH